MQTERARPLGQDGGREGSAGYEDGMEVCLTVSEMPRMGIVRYFWCKFAISNVRLLGESSV